MRGRSIATGIGVGPAAKPDSDNSSNGDNATHAHSQSKTSVDLCAVGGRGSYQPPPTPWVAARVCDAAAALGSWKPPTILFRADADTSILPDASRVVHPQPTTQSGGGAMRAVRSTGVLCDQQLLITRITIAENANTYVVIADVGMPTRCQSTRVHGFPSKVRNPTGRRCSQRGKCTNFSS